MDAQLKKGVLELCILSLVSRREQYGYDVIRRMQQDFPEMGESAFYVILRRLHGEGALEQFVGEDSGGPPRKYYRLTDEGLRRLAQQREDWEHLVEIVSDLTAWET